MPFPHLTPLLFLLTLSSLAAAPARQPNILMVFCDDLTIQAISAYGHPLELLETPNIDRLAKQGMRFDRTLVPNSLCGPSRAAILTGKYSHLNGFLRNGNRFDGGQQTFPKLLQKTCYQTALIGKWHLDSDPTGFNYWHILPGQGIYYNPPMIKNGEEVQHEGYTTDIITDLTLEWLEGRDRVQALSADEPAQGVASGVGSGAASPGLERCPLDADRCRAPRWIQSLLERPTAG